MPTSIMVIIGPDQDEEAVNAIVKTLGGLGYGFKELEMQFGALQRIPHTFGAVFAKTSACKSCGRADTYLTRRNLSGSYCSNKDCPAFDTDEP